MCEPLIIFNTCILPIYDVISELNSNRDKEVGRVNKNQTSFITNIFNEVCNKGLNFFLIFRFLDVVVFGVNDHDLAVLLPVNPGLVLLVDFRDVL